MLNFMHASWARALLLLSLLVHASSCAPPYKPFCRVVSSGQLGDQPGIFSPRPAGEVSLVSVAASADAGTKAVARVALFDSSGAELRRYELVVPAAATPLDALNVRRVVDTPEGVAALYTRREQRPGSDGGVETLAHQMLDLRFVDGGVRTIDVSGAVTGPLAPAILYRVGASVVVAELGAVGGFLFHVRRLQGWSDNGTALPVGLDLAEGSLIVPRADALLVTPGPGIVSDQLEVLGTLPAVPESDAFSSPAVAWSLADRIVWSAFVVDGSLLTQSFDFAGTSRAEPSRASSALRANAVAHSAHGLGILFTDISSSGSTTDPVEAWFAFVDAQGQKRGPDVALPIDFSGNVVIAASPTQDRFGLFTRGSAGLSVTVVDCD